MSTGSPIEITRVRLSDFSDDLSRISAFSGVSPDGLCGLGEADLMLVAQDVVIQEPTSWDRCFCLVLEGEIVADRQEQDGSTTRVGLGRTGDCFGEVVLLSGKKNGIRVFASKPSRLLRFSEDEFWQIMSCAPSVRKVVLANMSQRLHTYMAEAAHREKLISLGTLAAGLMHELHNPGSAAKRAASQLRENLLRLQELSLRFCDRENTPTQLACMRDLQEEAIAHARPTTMSSLEQSDAEETMAEWLDHAGVENAYRIAPSLVGIGLNPDELTCMRDQFATDGLSDALNWLEALVSSVSLVDAVEESISRVSELVMAVKKFAYDDRCTLRQIDLHDSIQSTLTILGHKIRIKNIEIDKHFDASPSMIHSSGVAISQVWTNLLDNAIDASPEGARLTVKTGREADVISVSITDHGSGIPEDLRERIFEPFFTTKPVGKGTGLGLEIVHRIITQQFKGSVTVTSEPGETTFTVLLPIGTAPQASTAPDAPVCGYSAR